MRKKLLLSLLFIGIIISTIGILSVSAYMYGTYGIFTYVEENGEVKITCCDDNAKGAIDIPADINGYPVTSIGASAFENCFDITSVSFPSTLCQIGNDAFSGCYNLQEVNFPSNLSKIGQWAFWGCSSLLKVEFPESLTTIGPYAFANCDRLSSITLPSRITTIYQYSFQNCGITSLTIYNNVDEIRSNAFSGCDLKSINYYGLESEWNTIDIAYDNTEIFNANIIANKKSGNYQYRTENDTATIVQVEGITGEVIIPESLDGYCVTKIGDKVFYNNQSITSVIIPDTVTHINKAAFNSCYSLSNVILSNNLTFIGEQAFTWCPFKNINLPESLVQIDYGAFAGCGYLKEITIPNGVKRLSDDIFLMCYKLEKVFLPYRLNSQVANMGLSNNTLIYCICEITYILDDGITITSYVIENTNATHSELPSIPVGYMYRYEVNGILWDGTDISCDTIVNVKVVPAEYIISYIGDYEENITIIHGNDVILPTSPMGFFYRFTANGVKWDGKNITGDTTVTVTKTPIKYTVTYTGDYTDVITADYGTTVKLPISPIGYAYTFAVDGKEWDGYVTGDTTVTVKKLCDVAELISIGLDDEKIDGNKITGEWPYKIFGGEITVSENASYAIYTEETCENSVSQILLSCGQNTFYIKVIAESGRSNIYTIIINRDIPISLGVLTVLNTNGGNIEFVVENKIPGNPKIIIYYGKTLDELNYSQDADFNSETQTISVSELPEGTEFYFKAVADYGDVSAESSIILEKTGTTLSDECYIIQTITPPGGTVTEGENGGIGSISDLRVTNKYSSITVDVLVSQGATWNLYKTATATKPIPNKEMSLIAGRQNNAYLRVVSEDGQNTNTYLISIYRQSKSSLPTILASNGIVTIIAAEESRILYTLDGTMPSEQNGKVYENAFCVEPGVKITAIAKQSDKDEYSDAVTYVVPEQSSVTVSEIYVYESSDKLYEYEFYVESPEIISGKFIVAMYSKDKFVGIDIQDISTDEDSMYGTVSVKEYPDSYKVFIWNDTTLFPFCNSLIGDFE